MKYNQKLPAKVEKELDAYVARIKDIKWFKPVQLKRADVDKQINVALKAFGVAASIEYRTLKTSDDWGAARDAARGAAWDAAWGAARDAARDAAWDAARGAARDAAWGAARDAARDAAWGATDLLAKHTPEKLGYNEKYPEGNYLKLIPLWEMGLYPIGVINDKFVCYVPDEPGAAGLLDTKATADSLDVVINSVRYVPAE